MWAAADDTRSAEFLQENMDSLDAHLDFVGSTYPVRFVGGGYDPVRMGDETRDEAPVGRCVLRFYDCWHANGRFYSLFRRKDLAEAWRNLHPFLGNDWVIIVRLLARGKLKRLTQGSVDLGRRGLSNSTGIFFSYRRRALHWLFPFYELRKTTWALVRNEPMRLRVQITARLMKLNVIAAKTQVAYEIRRRGQRV